MRLQPDRICAVFGILLACVAARGTAESRPRAANPDAWVACRALEVHTESARGTAVVLFHHADESSRAPLGEFLRAHSGAAVEIKIEGAAGEPVPGTVFRLKSCFGRGLLLLPAPAPLKEGAVFRLRLRSAQGGAAGASDE